MTDIIGVLCWYDEPDEWLRELVHSLKGVCTTLIAVDGPYKTFPHTTLKSPVSNYHALSTAAQAVNIRLVIENPTTAWTDEPAKRTWAVKAACHEATTFKDYLLIIDGDEYVSEYDNKTVHSWISKTKADVYTIPVRLLPGNGVTFNLWENAGEAKHKPKLFRALRNMYTDEHHSRLVGFNEQGTKLIVNGQPKRREDETLATPIPIPAVEISHRALSAGPHRVAAKREHYTTRDEGDEKASVDHFKNTRHPGET